VWCDVNSHVHVLKVRYFVHILLGSLLHRVRRLKHRDWPARELTDYSSVLLVIRGGNLRWLDRVRFLIHAMCALQLVLLRVDV